MLSGEIASGTKNPMSLVFYCFIPAVLWMIANDHKRKAKLMIDIKARVDQLEVSYRCE
jgi:hypothetical protein